MSDISHSAIAGGVNQPTNFAVVADSPGSFNQPEDEGLGVYQMRVRCECLEPLWISEDMSVSVMEDDAGVEKL